MYVTTVDACYVMALIAASGGGTQTLPVGLLLITVRYMTTCHPQQSLPDL